MTWAIEGCLKWQEEELKATNIVLKATGAYKDKMDITGKFISENYLPCPEAGLKDTLKYRLKAMEVYNHFLKWCEESGEVSISSGEFTMVMEEKGIKKAKKSGIVCFLGITSKPSKDEKKDRF